MASLKSEHPGNNFSKTLSLAHRADHMDFRYLKNQQTPSTTCHGSLTSGCSPHTVNGDSISLRELFRIAPKHKPVSHSYCMELPQAQRHAELKTSKTSKLSLLLFRPKGNRSRSVCRGSGRDGCETAHLFGPASQLQLTRKRASLSRDGRQCWATLQVSLH